MVFNFSKLRARCEAGEFGESYLIGDSGYACKSYLITPLANPSTRPEIAFQRAFIRTRIEVEKTIGVWKRRFPILGTSMYHNETVSELFNIICFRNTIESRNSSHHYCGNRRSSQPTQKQRCSTTGNNKFFRRRN